MGLVEPHEDRDGRPRGEVIAFGSQQQGPDVAVGRLVDSRAYVGEQIRAEEVSGRAVDHDLAKPIVSLERRERHLSAPSKRGSSWSSRIRTSRDARRGPGRGRT